MTGMRASLIFTALAVMVLGSCTGRSDPYAQGSRATDLKPLFGLLERLQDASPEREARQRFALSHKIASILVDSGRYTETAALLPMLPRVYRPKITPSWDEEGVGATRSRDDPYDAWYLYTAASAYEHQGAQSIAAFYYRRILQTCPDLIMAGQSIHFFCLARLAALTESPNIRIECYRQMIDRFPDRTDMGPVLFLLGREYEKTGAWAEAVPVYRQFLRYLGTTVPGHPEAFQYARRIVELSAGSRDWTSPDLDTLVTAIRAALASGSSARLRTLSTRVGFFAVSWSQGDDAEGNTKVSFDLAEFMRGGRIEAAPALDPRSGEREAYLRTKGWSGTMPVWYFFFRRLDFPADPETHGNWEWAGIYFGEKPQ